LKEVDNVGELNKIVIEKTFEKLMCAPTAFSIWCVVSKDLENEKFNSELIAWNSGQRKSGKIYLKFLFFFLLWADNDTHR
jgi:hypothetical protein